MSVLHRVVPCLPALLPKKCHVQNRLGFPRSFVSVFSSGAILWSKIQSKNLCMGFPYKTQEEYAAFRAGLQTNQGVSLQRWPVHLCGLFQTCSLPSRGFFLILCCVRAVCPHLAVPKALCSLKCFDLGFFF